MRGGFVRRARGRRAHYALQCERFGGCNAANGAVMAGSSNAVPKQLKPFVKGDPRINRKGRPKSFDAARALAQQIAHEIAKVRDKNNPDNEIELVIDDHYVTVTEAILRSWANSGDPKLSTAFMEWAYGKVPNVTEVTGRGGDDLTIKLTWGDSAVNDT